MAQPAVAASTEQAQWSQCLGCQAVAITESLRLLSSLPVPVVSVIIGEGGSGGALAIAVADRVLALSGAIYSQELTAQAPPELVARRQQRFREFTVADR